MSQRLKPNQQLSPSILDRLLDDDPSTAQEAPKATGVVLKEIKEAVRRDLENLLNTRWRCAEWPPHLTELETSLVNYGLPDFAAAHARWSAEPERLLEVVQQTIELFEPRLQNVRVESLQNVDSIDRTLRFRITATLFVDPIEDRVSYRSALEPTSGDFQVERL